MDVVEYVDATVFAKDLTEIVHCNCGMTTFRLAGVNLIAKNDDEMWELSKSFRSLQYLTTFILLDVTFEREGCVNLGQLVSMVLLTSSNLTTSCIKNTKAPSCAIAASRYCPCLQQLLLPENNFNDDDAVVIATAVTKCACLKVLDLQGTKLSKVGSAAFKAAIEKNTSRCTLRLKRNTMSIDGNDRVQRNGHARSGFISKAA